MVCLLPGLTACGATVTSVTTLEVRDASRVSVLRGDEVALPAGNAPAETSVGTTDVELVPGTRSQVDVSALRAPSGEILLRWATRPPIVTGEEPVMRADASAGPWKIGLPDSADLTASAFRWNLCASLRPGTCFPLTIETPWSNVVVTRRTTVVPRTRQALQKAALVAAGPLLLAALLPAGTDFGSADGAVLGVLGVSAGASGVLLGSSFLFPGPRTCTEILAPGSGTFAPRGSNPSLRAGARAGGTPRTPRDRSHGTTCRG
jgi:hypothetical protein